MTSASGTLEGDRGYMVATTPRAGGRPPTGPILAMVFLAAPAALFAQAPRYPTDIQRSAGGRETLGLRKENGFEDVEREVTFIVDPRISRKDSPAYRPDDPAPPPLEPSRGERP